MTLPKIIAVKKREIKLYFWTIFMFSLLTFFSSDGWGNLLQWLG
jgi:hypothetical protein